MFCLTVSRIAMHPWYKIGGEIGENEGEKRYDRGYHAPAGNPVPAKVKTSMQVSGVKQPHEDGDIDFSRPPPWLSLPCSNSPRVANKHPGG